jgi:RNA polymerase sigma-70 factor (ECF subfamily)
VKVYLSINGFGGRSSLFPWLHRITVNLSVEFLRKRKATTSFDSAPREVKQNRSQLSADPSPASDTLLMQRSFISKLLQRIPEEDRHLILLREMEGYSMAQLSKAAGLKQSALKARLFESAGASVPLQLRSNAIQDSVGNLSRAHGK